MGWKWSTWYPGWKWLFGIVFLHIYACLMGLSVDAFLFFHALGCQRSGASLRWRMKEASFEVVFTPWTRHPAASRLGLSLPLVTGRLIGIGIEHLQNRAFDRESESDRKKLSLKFDSYTRFFFNLTVNKINIYYFLTSLHIWTTMVHLQWCFEKVH